MPVIPLGLDVAETGEEFRLRVEHVIKLAVEIQRRRGRAPLVADDVRWRACASRRRTRARNGAGRRAATRRRCRGHIGIVKTGEIDVTDAGGRRQTVFPAVAIGDFVFVALAVVKAFQVARANFLFPVFWK